MTAEAFRHEMERRRFAPGLVGFIMQSTACNAVHSVEQQLARWLLMAQAGKGPAFHAHTVA